VKAVLAPISELLKPREKMTPPTTLSMDRAMLYASAMLRFHFYYGDFVQWLGGEYTNRHRDWDDAFDTIEALQNRAPPKGTPPSDLPWGKRIFTQGVPMKGHFTCPTKEIPVRNKYNNHPAVKKNHEAVEAKFAKEEYKYFHIHLLLW
jgi:hypothetical protein